MDKELKEIKKELDEVLTKIVDYYNKNENKPRKQQELVEDVLWSFEDKIEREGVII